MTKQDSAPFDRYDASSFTEESGIAHYRRYGFLWVRLGQKSENQNNTPKYDDILRQEFNSNPKEFAKNWSIENAGNWDDEEESTAKKKDRNKTELTPETVFSSTMEKKKFYVSTIIHRNQKETLERLLKGCLSSGRKDDDHEIEDSPHPLLANCRHDGGAWLFLGRNPPLVDNSNSNSSGGNGNNKRKREDSLLAGRAEHVDDVTHSGTWHAQLSGSKTWLIRPNVKAHDDWINSPPDLARFKGAERAESGVGRAWRLRITVEEGDLIVLNTRAWYHRTELQPSEKWSISLARDFHFPVAHVPCPTDVKKGEIVLDEDDIPDNIPTKTGGNCALVEVGEDDGASGDEDEDGGDGEGETRIVLVALQDIDEGDPLYLDNVIADDNEDEEDADDEENAPSSVDPRAVAKQDWGTGEIVLSGDEIPEDLPRSLEPNCEIVVENDEAALVSILPIQCGDVFTLTPDEDEEYEEVEVDLGTGEMIDS